MSGAENQSNGTLCHSLPSKTIMENLHASIEERAKALSEFGLTYNQAKVYCSALVLGTTSIEPISKISGIRREDVYRILPRLFETGIIERVPVQPTRIKAISEKEAIPILIEHEKMKAQKAIDQLSLKTKTFFDKFELLQQINDKDAEEEQFLILDSSFAIIKRLNAMVQDVQKSLIISCLGDLFENWEFQYLIEHMTSGAIIRIIAEQTQRKEGVGPTKRNSIQVKYGSHLRGSYIVADEAQALIDISGKNHDNRKYLYTENELLIALVEDNFRQFWESVA